MYNSAWFVSSCSRIWSRDNSIVKCCMIWFPINLEFFFQKRKSIISFIDDTYILQMLMPHSTCSTTAFGKSNPLRKPHNKLACETPRNSTQGLKQNTIKIVQKNIKKSLTNRLLLHFLLLKQKRKKPNYQRHIMEMAMNPTIKLNWSLIMFISFSIPRVKGNRGRWISLCTYPPLPHPNLLVPQYLHPSLKPP